MKKISARTLATLAKVYCRPPLARPGHTWPGWAGFSYSPPIYTLFFIFYFPYAGGRESMATLATLARHRK